MTEWLHKTWRTTWGRPDTLRGTGAQFVARLTMLLFWAVLWAIATITVLVVRHAYFWYL